ncbi:calcium-binding protein [Mangrovicoccus ximenensis]|uniref:calcium-binding protein n=1 Tax=Mangrovicoccus ximenensis TaxID=1911570 RepID=UPI000D34266D|nr:calcium-binding protein [Mangrovicoccus ximenensis]
MIFAAGIAEAEFVFHADGTMSVVHGNATDRLHGIETLVFADAAFDAVRAEHVDTIDYAGGNRDLGGTAANDVLAGGAGDDAIEGFAGADQILGGAGNDKLRGGLGRDTIGGGNGDDRREKNREKKTSERFRIATRIRTSATRRQTWRNIGRWPRSFTQVLRILSCSGAYVPPLLRR